MINTDSTDEELLDALQRVSGDLLAALDPKHCFLTVEAMTQVSRLKHIRSTIKHVRRQKHDKSPGDRPVKQEVGSVHLPISEGGVRISSEEVGRKPR